MRSRPATRTASFVCSCAALVTARRRHDCFGPTALHRSAAFAETSCRCVLLRARIRNCCGGQRPFLLRKASRGRRPQRPGNQFALARVSGRIPSAILFRESPAATGSAAIGQAQELSRFAAPTFIQAIAYRNTKNWRPCAETVDDDNSLWKTEEN